MPSKRLIAAGAAFAVAGLGAAIPYWQAQSVRTYPVMDLGTMTAADLSFESYRVTPAMLSVIYAAFAETDEAAIYDTLALVAHGDALEALYLERIGAMQGGGLEPDQTIHEIALLNLGAQARRRSVEIDATWRVLGTVGHAEHLHVRGNAYSAVFVMEPKEGTWVMTGFDLTNVDRTDAGTFQEQEDNPFFEAPAAEPQAAAQSVDNN